MRRFFVVLCLAMLMPVMVATPQPVAATFAYPDCQPQAVPVAPFADTPEHRYFPVTKHSLNFGFKAFWDAHGGLAIFGYPIEEEHSETLPSDTGPRTIQYFERARFEYHPEFKGTPYEVELGLMGREYAGHHGYTGLSATAPAASAFQSPPAPALDPPFQAFWYANGGLPIFGYPISQPFSEYNGNVGKQIVVQYFERARMEVHGELSGSPILLGRLGSEGYGVQGLPCRDPRTGLLA